MEINIKKAIKQWNDYELEDADLKKELIALKENPNLLNDAFYRDLEFGTGGLRGVIGVGTNRMNIYTVAKASQGLANYVVQNFKKEQRRIAISYDSRIKSDKFAQIAAEVFVANGIQVFMYPNIMPTPTLSFAVRELSCAAGIMITASHNPSKYNGYKVYGADGCQITTKAAAIILAEIEKLNIFVDIKRTDFDVAVETKKVVYIDNEVFDKFIKKVQEQSLLRDEEIDKNVAIVYSPLNGTGLVPVTTVLKKSGFNNITVVKEQEQPDGNFPTCPYPNPEIHEAMELGIKYAQDKNADLLLATDPDCDRVGIAVKNSKGEHVLLSGNETGMLLLDYICSRRIELGIMPQNPELVKTIVTIDMADRIAAHYGVKTVNLLTGFKFIGEEIGRLEKDGHKDSYIFGFEESYGYLSGTYVRDKDAVNGAFLICEMFAYYKSHGISLLDKLNELYSIYGYTLNTLHSYAFEGESGFDKMQKVMDKFRNNIQSIGSEKVEKVLDYGKGVGELPKSNVLKFILSNNCSVVVRPSGTEPKLKAYISVSADTNENAKVKEKQIVNYLELLIK